MQYLWHVNVHRFESFFLQLHWKKVVIKADFMRGWNKCQLHTGPQTRCQLCVLTAGSNCLQPYSMYSWASQYRHESLSVKGNRNVARDCTVTLENKSVLCHLNQVEANGLKDSCRFKVRNLNDKKFWTNSEHCHRQKHLTQIRPQTSIL